MTDRIDEIRARCDAATPGPWELDQDVWHGDECIAEINRPANAAFIAHSRDDIPYLLSEIDLLTEAHEAMLRDLQTRSAQVAALGKERDEYKVALQNWHEGE